MTLDNLLLPVSPRVSPIALLQGVRNALSKLPLRCPVPDVGSAGTLLQLPQLSCSSWWCWWPRSFRETCGTRRSDRWPRRLRRSLTRRARGLGGH